MSRFKINLLLVLLTVYVSAEYKDFMYYDPEISYQRFEGKYSRFDRYSYTCQELVYPISHFTVSSIYRDDDPTKSIIDPVKKALFDEENKHVLDFIHSIIKASNYYIKQSEKDQNIKECIKNHIHHWVSNQAMTVPHLTNVGYAKQTQVLKAAAQGIKLVGIDNLQDVQGTKEWLELLADRVIQYYQDPQGVEGVRAGPNTSNNNHRYWDGLGVGLVSVILGDNNNKSQQYFKFAMDGFLIGVNQIENDGTLPLEMARLTKAWSYTTYAARPLVALAEFGVQNRDKIDFDPYEVNNRGMERLITLMMNEHTKITSDIFVNGIQELKCTETCIFEIYLRRNWELKSDSVKIVKFLQKTREDCNFKANYSTLGGDFIPRFGYTDSELQGFVDQYDNEILKCNFFESQVECSGNTPVCSQEDGICYGCNYENHLCGDGQFCTVDGSCTSQCSLGYCPDGQQCDEANNECVSIISGYRQQDNNTNTVNPNQDNDTNIVDLVDETMENSSCMNLKITLCFIGIVYIFLI